jgi:hypothetical protein
MSSIVKTCGKCGRGYTQVEWDGELRKLDNQVMEWGEVLELRLCHAPCGSTMAIVICEGEPEAPPVFAVLRSVPGTQVEYPPGVMARIEERAKGSS